ncbi:neuropilin and tolloid-like protein 2 isoform X1 [Centruroides vittatus]|uniref:neuropilin and tolloid-like protein 2 isoform X1 n=1 Tax=Centruroides vittatus TaxID=120091 RepID=UPI003510BB70
MYSMTKYCYFMLFIIEYFMLLYISLILYLIEYFISAIGMVFIFQFIQLEGKSASSLSTEYQNNHNGIDNCYNFSKGNEKEHEFFSPHYPNNYPSNIRCTRQIKAEPGYIIKLHFRDHFHLEDSENCEYDYLEIREGPHGYSTVKGKYCGNTFPKEITSKGQYLWLEFRSDDSIEYKGFKVYYEFYEAKGDGPDKQNCYSLFGGIQGTINYSSIDGNLIKYSNEHKQPLDCVWEIRVTPGYHIAIKFHHFSLPEPNHCDINMFEIYNESLSSSGMQGKFCGTKADSKTIDRNVAYVRFFGLPWKYLKQSKKKGVEFFSLVYTAQRPVHSNGKTCDPSLEFDCGDGFCIDSSLVCNGITNCKYKYDEENCEVGLSLASVLSSQQMISILIVFSIMILGMCISLSISCYTKVKQRQEKEREYRERRSKEASVECNLESGNERGVDHVQNTEIGSRRKAAKWLQDVDEENGCYVPEVDLSVFRKQPNGGDTIPHTEETSFDSGTYPVPITEPKRPFMPPSYSEVGELPRSSPPPLPPHRGRDSLYSRSSKPLPEPPVQGPLNRTVPEPSVHRSAQERYEQPPGHRTAPERPPFSRVTPAQNRPPPTPMHRASVAQEEDDDDDDVRSPHQIRAQAVIEATNDGSRARSFESTSSAPDVIVKR